MLCFFSRGSRQVGRYLPVGIFLFVVLETQFYMLALFVWLFGARSRGGRGGGGGE